GVHGTLSQCEWLQERRAAGFRLRPRALRRELHTRLRVVHRHVPALHQEVRGRGGLRPLSLLPPLGDNRRCERGGRVGARPRLLQAGQGERRCFPDHDVHSVRTLVPFRAFRRICGLGHPGREDGASRSNPLDAEPPNVPS
ncbi:unnamed protein product, partial [Phaeothamnion confervicola]